MEPITLILTIIGAFSLSCGLMRLVSRLEGER